MSKDQQAMAVAMMCPVTLARASTGKPASCRMFFGNDRLALVCTAVERSRRKPAAE
jgi:hypothetical protein